MNKLLTYPGGQPFTTGDIDYLQDCYTSIINALSKGICGNKNCILWGITNNDAQELGVVIPGAVFIEGEIFLVTSEIKNLNRYLCFRKVEKENRTFADSGKHNVYLTYEPYVAATTEGSYKSIEINTAITLQDIVSQEEFWVDEFGVSFPANVKGFVKTLKRGERIRYYCQIFKTSTTDNILFNYPYTRASLPFVGFLFNGDQITPRVVIMTLGKGKVYNMDGSEYKGTVSARFYLEQNDYAIRV